MRIFSIQVPVFLLVMGLIDALAAWVAITFGLALSYGRMSDVIAIGGSFEFERVLFTSIVMLSAFTMGVYRRENVADRRMLAVRIAVALVLAVFVLSLVFYIVPEIRIWLSALVPSLVIVGLFWILNRMGFYLISGVTVFHRRVLVLGVGRQARCIEDLERRQGVERFTCVGFVNIEGSAIRVSADRVLLKSNDLQALCRSLRVDEIVVALEERRGYLPTDMLLACKLGGMRVLSLSAFLEGEFGQVEIEGLYPSWLIFSTGTVGGRVQRALKRAVDIVASVILLLLTLPFTLLTALAIFLQDGGPIFYRQDRVGAYGRRFQVWKFRSMRIDSESDGVARWASQRDGRVTFVGRIIRKLRIDEIPQILNVLRGEMSFIGPRPEQSMIVTDLAKHIPFYEYRHVVKPGITGWAQVNYPYGASVEDAAEKLKFDLYYIKNYSIFLDLIILLQTIRVVLWPEGAR